MELSKMAALEIGRMIKAKELGVVEATKAALENIEKLHHDVGFMWHILSGANYRITGNKASKTRNLYAAALLFARYNPGAGYIRAWNFGEEGWTIIDTMMNIPWSNSK